MNSNTHQLTSKYKPSMAIVVYCDDYNQYSKSYYLESHDIDASGQLLEGKPLQQSTIQGIVDVFFDDRKNQAKIGGLIPHNLLSFDSLPGGTYKIAWHRPAEKRVLHFSPSLSIPSGEAWVPPMLYTVENRSLCVYALKSDDRPDGNTSLFRAPYHNVSKDGIVCLGSAKVKKPETKTFESIMKYWEDMFWLSEFTHLSGGSPVKTNINMVWNKLITNPDMSWSELDELLPSDKLKDLIK